MPKDNNNNNNKTIWCTYYIDDFNTTRVKILDIRGGKYRIIDDKEGGKYIGRIVDASDVSYFEIWVLRLSLMCPLAVYCGRWIVGRWSTLRLFMLQLSRYDG